MAIESLEELLEKFGKAPTQQKYLGVLVLSGIFWAMFYFLLYSDTADQVDRLGRKIKQLGEEKATYEDKKQRYMALRAEVKRLEQEQKELLKILPTEKEVAGFLKSLHAQAELAGLNITVFDRADEEVRDFYARIPVKMSISGTYHQIIKFMYSVGRLKRIVNVQDLLLDAPKKTDQGIILKAKFVASTFRFIAPKKKG